MDLDLQLELFDAALDALDEDDNIINRVVEITLDDAKDAEMTVTRYELQKE
jgi:hypothetical protein